MRKTAKRRIGQGCMFLGGTIIIGVEVVMYEAFYETLGRTFVSGDMAGTRAVAQVLHSTLVAGGIPVDVISGALTDGAASGIVVAGLALVCMGAVIYRRTLP